MTVNRLLSHANVDQLLVSCMHCILKLLVFAFVCIPSIFSLFFIKNWHAKIFFLLMCVHADKLSIV